MRKFAGFLAFVNFQKRRGFVVDEAEGEHGVKAESR
jgi:hypothetical protein